MNNDRATWASLFLMPSFYGVLTWPVSLILFHLRLIEWNTPCVETVIMCWSAAAVFIISTILMAPTFRRLAGKSSTLQPHLRYLKFEILLLHCIGFIGLLKYCADAAAYLGGPVEFLYTIMYKSHEIRWANEEMNSIGTQLSYFGWAAIAFSAYGISRKRLSWAWAFPIVLQFSCNFLFIDRTRPIWISFVTALVVFFAKPDRSLASVAKTGACLMVFFLSVFFIVAVWVGKVSDHGKYGRSSLTPAAQNAYYYITSGYPYLDAIVKRETGSGYDLSRSLFPAVKVLSKFGIVKAPPNRVNDFYDVPFSTNVGTFLEPLYRDGGVLYAIIGILILGVGCNFLSLLLLRSGSLWCVFLWAHICFSAFIAFFTPKFCTTSLWLFAVMAFLSLWRRMVSHESSVTDQI